MDYIQLILGSKDQTFPTTTIQAMSLARLERGSELARVRSALGNRLRLVARGSALELLADLLDTGCASSAVDSSSVAKVRVDANE